MICISMSRVYESMEDAQKVTLPEQPLAISMSLSEELLPELPTKLPLSELPTKINIKELPQRFLYICIYLHVYVAIPCSKTF